MEKSFFPTPPFSEDRKKEKKKHIYGHADNRKKLHSVYRHLSNKKKMFATVYSIEISLINPMIQCLSQATASEKIH